jgi:hypothetical protein
VQVDSNQVYLVSDRLEKFALVGESEGGKKAVKTLRLVAFAQAQSTTTEYTIRVYVLEDTISALEVCIHECQTFRIGSKVLNKIYD